MSNLICVCHSFNSCMHSTSKFLTRRVCLTNLSFLVDVVFCFVLFFGFFLSLSLEENFSKLCFWKNKASIFVPKSVCLRDTSRKTLSYKSETLDVRSQFKPFSGVENTQLSQMGPK